MARKIMDIINDMGNALTACGWPKVGTPGGSELDTAQIFKELADAGKDYKDCVNELCYKCGDYKREHEGVCDGCRWQKPRRGW